MEGKGKSGGFEGQCYSRGEYGHSARFCPHGNGKSKGKGKEQTICYNCGNASHIAMNCPKGKGKGAAMSWLKSGKGAGGQCNVGAVQQSGPVVGNLTDSNHVDFTPPLWDNANQALEADFGGSWDATINAVSRDSQWTVVTRRARGNSDMRPIKFASGCC